MKLQNKIADLVFASRQFGINISLLSLIKYLRHTIISDTSSPSHLFALAHGLVSPSACGRVYQITLLGDVITGSIR